MKQIFKIYGGLLKQYSLKLIFFLLYFINNAMEYIITFQNNQAVISSLIIQIIIKNQRLSFGLQFKEFYQFIRKTKIQQGSIQSVPKRTNTMIIKQKFQMELQTMEKQIFSKYHTTKCQQHLLQKQNICLQQKCQYFNRILCADCRHCSHKLINLNKIVPQLNQWIIRQNKEISQQNRNLTDQWRIVQQNITYCVDIFNQLLKVIENHLEKRIYAPKNFIQITNIVYGMFSHDSNNKSPQNFLKNWINLQKKFNLFNEDKQNQNQQGNQNHSWFNIFCQKLQNQKSQRLKKARQANKKSKQFSQKALFFAQSLAYMIQNKIKEEEIKVKIKQMKIKNQMNLKDLLKHINLQNERYDQNSKIQSQKILQSVQKFSFQISNKDENSFGSLKDIQNTLDQMKNLKNLKQIRVNNKNGKIDDKGWYHIINYVDMLKFLKQLRLTLSQSDIETLKKLFKQKHNAIRQVQNLTLQISDQKDLSLEQVNKFLLIFELRKLTLILTRNNLDGKKIGQFIRKLKVYTSLSQLPLVELSLNISANKVYVDQKIQIQKLFQQKGKNIKFKSIIT